MSDDRDQTTALMLRVAQAPPVRLLVLGGGLFLLMGISSGFMVKFAASPMLRAVVAAGMVALALAFYVGFARLVERRPASELSLTGAGRELGGGIIGGAGLYTLCVLILMVPGIYRIDGLNSWSYLLPAVAMALSSGFFEELLFRGALFRIVEEWLGSWISLIVSSLVFGFVHLLNPAATLTGALFISIEAGLLLAAAYMLTRRLWLSIGFHFAWNYTQSAIFSGIVSGNEAAPGLIKPTITGPVLLTGGSFGLEASVVAFALCTATGVALLVAAVRRGNVVQPFWRRAG
jgi:membrane protease YdiL (CAAX protease family)